MREYPGRLHHQTPGWVQDGSLFHLRLRVEAAQTPPLTAPLLAPALLAAAKRYHDLGHWWCELFLLMPDHAHAIVAFPPEPGMSEVLRHWKRGTTRFQSVQWQEGYFDHRLRHAAAFAETWHYLRRNPLVKNLCATEADWRWWWSGVVANPALPPELR